ncbi:hypothetical protein QZM22_12520 [Burkholderia oklahomensis]|uniref:hypothetical protein n=1 Tax=Burkholderia oklahomensis TaxID=342113 RepID=UPI0026537EB4|nr:hypothetical protein [Burkholderia oklahomensis]MDN7673321.1 hypothetical protein [Burkholderia oklahomensis]
MSAVKTMTTGARLRASCGSHDALAPAGGDAESAADAFSAWLDAQPGDAPPHRAPAGDASENGAADGPRARTRGARPADASAPPGKAPAGPRPSPSDVLTLRIANGPLAGLTLHARFAGGALVVALDSALTDAGRRAHARRMRGPLEAALAAQFAQPVTLEWSDAADTD